MSGNRTGKPQPKPRDEYDFSRGERGKQAKQFVALRRGSLLPPAMNKTPPAVDPDAYVAALDGWRRELVEALRAGVRVSKQLTEVVKWGHLVYLHGGPVLLIRAEEQRVLFGFWRGQQLMDVEPRLKPGGMYEMATLDLREGMTVKPTIVRRLVRAAMACNEADGDPTRLAKPAARPKAAATRRAGKGRRA